jgi:hypothetical protein
MTQEALKLALEALVMYGERHRATYLLGGAWDEEITLGDKAITALEEALVQPEQEEKLPPVEIGVDVTDIGTTVVAFYRRPNAVMEMFYSQFHPLAQPKQEPVMWSDYESNGIHHKPVAWMDADGNVSDNNDHKCFPIPLYTHPPQRTWVDVPDEEIKRLWIQYRAALPRYLCFAKDLLSIAKEKNI